jgi:hypothetical protein
MWFHSSQSVLHNHNHLSCRDGIVGQKCHGTSGLVSTSAKTTAQFYAWKQAEHLKKEARGTRERPERNDEIKDWSARRQLQQTIERTILYGRASSHIYNRVVNSILLSYDCTLPKLNWILKAVTVLKYKCIKANNSAQINLAGRLVLLLGTRGIPAL